MHALDEVDVADVPASGDVQIMELGQRGELLVVLDAAAGGIEVLHRDVLTNQSGVEWLPGHRFEYQENHVAELTQAGEIGRPGLIDSVTIR